MFLKIKKYFDTAINWLDRFMFDDEPGENLYCIPCTWTLSGRVYVRAADIETAKAYVHTHKTTPEVEECFCYKTTPNTNQPILCVCGNCNKEYVVSAMHNSHSCPYCGNGGDEH